MTWSEDLHKEIADLKKDIKKIEQLLENSPEIDKKLKNKTEQNEN